MSKFNVGDRVAVYGHYMVADGSKAMVRQIFDSVSLDLLLVGPTSAPNVIAHPKQCRRLKKRERWEIEFRIGENLYDHPEYQRLIRSHLGKLAVVRIGVIK